MILATIVMATILGLGVILFWLTVAFKRPPDIPLRKVTTSKEIVAEFLKQESREEIPGQVYEYTEGGVTQIARPGTEVHRMIEEVVRRRP